MNTYFFHKINSLAGLSPISDALFVFCAVWLGYVIILTLTVLLLSDRRKHIRMAVVSFISGVFARFILVTLIRMAYNHPRPFVVLSDATQLIWHESSSSFPSGHSAFFFALAAGVYPFEEKWGKIFYVAAALIGFSRIVAGVHWPYDVVGGAIVGILSGYGFSLISKRFLK